jgi:hypothetical protein
MCKRILGRMRETKVTDTKLNWLDSALIARQPIDPSNLMINLRLGISRNGGCDLSILAISLRSGISRNPEHLPGTSLEFEYVNQGKYISGDETGGFKVAKVSLPLPDPRLRLFIQGKEDWLEEGLLVQAKKNKRGRIVEEGSSSAQVDGAQQNYVPPYGGIPTPPSYYGGPLMQEWGSGAAMPTPNYVVPNVNFAEPYAQLPQPQRSVAITRGYAARNMQNIAAIQSNAAQLGEGNANIAYELGHLHLVPRVQFIGGDIQSYYEQWYNHQDYQYQPPTED